MGQILNSDLASSYFPFNTPTVIVFLPVLSVRKKNLDAQRKLWMLKEKFGINLASKGPPMTNLVCNEKFGINRASAEAQFGTGRGIIEKILHFFTSTFITALTH